MAERETVLRRKLGAQSPAEAASADTGARSWRTAFARAAREEVALDLGTTALRDERYSLAEVLEIVPPQSLLALLEGPEMALGLLVMSPSLSAAVIEAQTMGRLSPSPAPPRRPTRTDAAMCAVIIDRALATLDVALGASADLRWAGGFRYASFLEEPRALALLLDDLPYRALISELEIGGAGARQGLMMLVLPAEGRGPAPVAPQLPSRDQQARQDWQRALSEAVLDSAIAIEAQMGRILLPLGQARALQPGAVLPLSGARTDQVQLHVAGGGTLPPARLGQHRGQRAIKITLAEPLGAEPVPLTIPAPDAAAGGG